MADTTIDLLKNSSYVGKMDELIAAVKSGGGTASDVEWDNVKNKPTTIGGYGIIDAKIDNGTITLGNQTITPLTSAPVTSVNSQTGAVVLTANDVSAIPSTLTGTAGQVLTKTADGQEWKDVDIPTALPNPNALTFTGAVSGSYDGSAPLSVEIPSGGGGSGWELVSDTTLSEDVSQLGYTGLDCYDLRVAIFGRWNDADDSLSNNNINANILLNEAGTGYQYKNGQIGYIRPSGVNFHTLIEATAANALYPTVVVSLLPSGDAVSLKAQSYTFESLNFGSSWKNGKTAKLNKIIIVPATSGVMLKSGSRIIVMKRS